MDENEVKIRLKCNGLEIDYEGQKDFLGNDLTNLIGKFVDFSNLLGIEINTPDKPDSPKQTAQETIPNKKLDLSPESIAARLAAKTGPEIVLTAAAYLTFVENQEVFSRDELLDTMKKMTSHYRDTMGGGNLTQSLKRLTDKQFLNKNSSGRYALGADKKAEVEKLLFD